MSQEQFIAQFNPKPPPKNQLKLFFNQDNLGSRPIDLDAVVEYRPHFALHPVWVILQASGNKIGIATLYIPPSKSILSPPVFIGNFIIRSPEQKKGAGTKMLGEIEQYCIKRSFLKLALEFSQPSLPFWHLKGFTVDPKYPTLLFKQLLR